MVDHAVNHAVNDIVAHQQHHRLAASCHVMMTMQRAMHLAMQRTIQHITQRTCHPPVGSRRVTITRPSWLGPHRGRWPRPARPVRPMGLRGAPG